MACSMCSQFFSNCVCSQIVWCLSYSSIVTLWLIWIILESAINSDIIEKFALNIAAGILIKTPECCCWYQLFGSCWTWDDDNVECSLMLSYVHAMSNFSATLQHCRLPSDFGSPSSSEREHHFWGAGRRFELMMCSGFYGYFRLLGTHAGISAVWRASVWNAWLGHMTPFLSYQVLSGLSGMYNATRTWGYCLFDGYSTDSMAYTPVVWTCYLDITI